MDTAAIKRLNIIDMAFGFSSMTRVFEKESSEKIINQLDSTLSQIALSQNMEEFQNIHDSFCRWFEKHIKTAERVKDNVVIKKSTNASYGQGAKVLDVALKVYIYYCNEPVS